eukprot:403364873
MEVIELVLKSSMLTQTLNVDAWPTLADDKNFLYSGLGAGAFLESMANANIVNNPQQFYCVGAFGELLTQILAVYSYLFRFYNDQTTLVNLMLSYPAIYQGWIALNRIYGKCITSQTTQSFYTKQYSFVNEFLRDSKINVTYDSPVPWFDSLESMLKYIAFDLIQVVVDILTIKNRYDNNQYPDLGFFITKTIVNVITEIKYITTGFPASL